MNMRTAASSSQREHRFGSRAVGVFNPSLVAAVQTLGVMLLGRRCFLGVLFSGALLGSVFSHSLLLREGVVS
jgi:hypothetical protein